MAKYKKFEFVLKSYHDQIILYRDMYGKNPPNFDEFDISIPFESVENLSYYGHVIAKTQDNKERIVLFTSGCIG
ncbi:MAG: hypothetical protein LBG46_02875, partial [Elusimicrobiota bacterium]|nr:hypothetical protein [Elusimicrobiota bacterium]